MLAHLKINYGFARPRTTDKNVYISNSLLALALHSPKCVYVWTRSSAGFRPQVGDELQLRPPLLLYLTSGGCRNSSAATDLFIFPTLCLQFIFYHISACDLLFREPGPNSSAVLKGSTASPLCILASGAIVHILILSSDTIVSILWSVRAAEDARALWQSHDRQMVGCQTRGWALGSRSLRSRPHNLYVLFWSSTWLSHRVWLWSRCA